MDAEKVELIVLAACALHNFLRTKATDTYMSHESIDSEDLENHNITEGEWRNGPTPHNNFFNLSNQGGNRTRIENREIRDEFCNYFISSGQVS